MAASIGDVNKGLRDRLATVPGLRVFDYQPDAIFPPVAYPSLTSIDYHKAMGGGMQTYNYTITVITGRTDDRSASDEMDAFASYDGARSIRAAIEADLTLGGVIDTLIMSSSASVSSLTQGDSNFVTIDFQLTAYA